MRLLNFLEHTQATTPSNSVSTFPSLATSTGAEPGNQA